MTTPKFCPSCIGSGRKLVSKDEWGAAEDYYRDCAFCYGTGEWIYGEAPVLTKEDKKSRFYIPPKDDDIPPKTDNSINP